MEGQMKSTRQEVYAALDGERAYQDSLWSPENGGNILESRRPEEWLIYMDVYLRKAQDAITSDIDSIAIPNTMHIIRKIGAMCVAAMEQNGAPPRARQ
jgi:hypothetical protein